MLFAGLVLFSIFLYIRGYKISALIIFFFFLTNGFNLIPDEIVDLGTPLTKSTDYAFFILLGMLTIELVFHFKEIKIDLFVKLLIVFFSYLFLCILYNRFVLGISFGEIIRTVRFLFFWLAYFVLRSMDEKQLHNLLKCLFAITVFISILYICQIFVGDNILVEMATSKTSILGVTIKRFYNQPIMLHFMVFMAIYNNPIKGKFRTLSVIILIFALLGAFHRSHIGFFILSIVLGFLLKLPRLKRSQILMFFAIVSLFATIFLGNRFVKSRTFIDIKTVMNGNVADVDIDMTELENATFTFRMAHLFERNEYVKKNPKTMLFGGGLLPEDSRKVEKLFDFKVGVIEDLTSEKTQLDTSDISYSFLLIRFGYLGTVLFLGLYFYLAYYFYKNRNNAYGFFSFIYLIMAFGVSFFSSNLIGPITFVLPMISLLIIPKTIKVNE